MAVPARSPGTIPVEGHSWPSPEQLRAFAPIVRLLSEIGAVPQVSKIGVTVTETRATLWVFMVDDDYEAEAQVARAERSYLNATRATQFEIQTIPGTDISPAMLPPYTVLFER